MNENKDVLGMGLGSIADVLYNIYLETKESKNILEKIHESLVDNFKSFLKTKPNITMEDVAKNNNNFLKSFLKNFFGMFNSDGTKQSIPKNSAPIIENQNVINFGNLTSEKVMKKFNFMLENLIKLIEFPKEKFEKIINFFSELNNVLGKISPNLYKVGLGLSFVTLSLIGLNFVSLMSIMKLAVILPVLGMAFGLFIGMLTSAINKTSFWKTFVVLHQIPAIFLAMGKSVLFLSIGLLFFEKVGWGSMLKMASAMLFLSVVFSRYISNGKVVDFAVLISLGVSIFFLAKSLTSLENIQWETLAKFGVFIMSLGMALSLFKISNNATSNMGGSGVLFMLSISLIGISYALNMLSDNVKWSDVFIINSFIIGLGLSLKLGGFTSMTINPLTMLSLGVLALSFALMSMANVDIVSVLKVIGVIGLLGFTINRLTGKGNFSASNLMGGNSTFGIIKFAIGLAVMTLALYALDEVPFTAMFKTIAFVAGLGLALRAFSGNSKYSGMTGFAFGLGLMVLAILAMEELPFWAMVKTLLFVVALGLVTKVFGGSKLGGLTGFAFGLGLMVLAIYAMNELPFKAMILTLGFLSGLALITKLFTKVSILTMISLSGAIFALTYSFSKLSDTNIEWNTLLKLGVFVAGFGALVAGLGVPAVSALVGLGSVVMLGLMTSALMSVLALKKISNLDIKYSNIWDFMLGVGTLALGFALVSIPAVLGIIGASLFIPIALSAMLGAEALSMISNKEFNTQNIDNFMLGVKSISQGFFENAMAIGVGLIPATMFLVIASTAYLTAVTLEKINGLNLNPNKVIKFSESMNLLVKLYDKFGLVSLGKSALKATTLLPIMATTYLSALTLAKINKVDISKSKIESFSESFNTLITVISDTISQQKDKLKDITPALKSVTGIVNISSQLAQVVQQMSDLKFNEYDVQNGKLVLIGQRKLIDKDFKAVGENMGVLINALLDPINQLGSNSSSFTIGNKVIANPFKSNNQLKGMDIIKRIGDTYTPLANMIKTLADSNMTDINKAKDISSNMMIVTYSFGTIFDELGNAKFKNASKSITELIRFNELLGGLNNKTLDKFNVLSTGFVNNFSDNIKWKNIRSNINYMRKEVELMVKSINTLNMDKAKFFETNLKLLVDKQNTEQLGEILEILRDLMGLAVEYNMGNTGNSSTNYDDSLVGNSPNVSPNITPTNQTNNTETNNIFDSTEMVNKLTEVGDMLSQMNQKLSGVLKVKQVNSANSI